jgi:hypothetical protein
LNTSDLSAKDAANKTINAVLNSTSNRVLQNKYLAQINSTILERKTVVENIAEKAKLQLGGINLSSLTNLSNLQGMAADRLRSGIQSRINTFVQTSIVNFKQSFNSAKSFFKGFF